MDGRYWLRRGFVRHFCVIISVQAHRALGGYRRLRTRTWLGLNSRQWISAEWTVVGSADAQQTAIHALAAGCADRRQSEALGPKVKGSDARQIAASHPNSAGASAVAASSTRPTAKGPDARQIAANCPNSARARGVDASSTRPTAKDPEAPQIAVNYPNSIAASAVGPRAIRPDAAERKVVLHSQAFRARWLCASCSKKLPHIKSLRTLFWFKPSSIMYTNQRIKQHYHA